jgi:hypothetical protein
MRTWRAPRSQAGLVLLASLMSLGAFSASSAFAVHDTGRFELDGNATRTVSDDWDEVCHKVTITDDLTDNVNNIPDECATAADPNGATAVSWAAELDTNATIFTGGGSKDPEDVSAWAWKDGAGGLPDKDNLTHAFAARYSLTPSATTCPSTGATCDVLFFGSDRFDNSGDAHQAFWFFQNKITRGSAKSGGGFTFNGVHRNGDLLVISNFSNGGTTSTILVYQWNTAVAGNLELLDQGTNKLCQSALASNDTFCGIVNPADGTAAPWTFLDKSGLGTYLQGELYEGGINLSALGLDDECFSSVVSETRSSTSTTATLKDFVLGQFATCTATMSTQASSNGNVVPGTSVTDTATIIGSSPSFNPTGTVTFFLCAVTGTNACTTGGTNIGTGPLNPLINSPGRSTAVSPAVNTGAGLAPGKYCFRAEWPGDLNYTTALSHTNNSTECFTVKDTSSVVTAQSWLPQDKATVTTAGGTAVAGSVKFELFNSNNCNPTTKATEFTDSTVGTGGVFETNNTTYKTESTTISWLATFTPSDTNAVVGSTANCETSTLTITN